METAAPTLDMLPIELLVEIFTYCIDLPEDALTIVFVCRKWKETLFGLPSNHLWERLAKLDYPYLELLNVKMKNWFILYRARRKAAWLVKHDEKYPHLIDNFATPIEECGLTKKRQCCQNQPKENESENVQEELESKKDEELEFELDCPMVLGNLRSVVSLAHDPYKYTHNCGVCGCVVRVAFTEKAAQDNMLKEPTAPLAWVLATRRRLVPTGEAEKTYFGLKLSNSRLRMKRQPFDSHSYWRPPPRPPCLQLDQIDLRISKRMEKMKEFLQSKENK